MQREYQKRWKWKYEIDRLGSALGVLSAPGLAPEPLLRQREDGDIVSVSDTLSWRTKEKEEGKRYWR